jgi:hypothetical protein
VARPLPLAIPSARGGCGLRDRPHRRLRPGRAISSALGWRGGDRLTLTASAGVMVARRDPDGMITVAGWPYIVIPAAVGAAAGGFQLE